MTSPRERSSLLLCAFGYFGGVFGAGFVFGVVRTLFVLPRVGETTAELFEAPLMLVVIVVAAWILAKRYRGPRSRLGLIGCVAASFVLIADIAVGYFFRGLSPYAVIFEREPVTGSAYYALLVVFAALPYFLTRSERSPRTTLSL